MSGSYIPFTEEMKKTYTILAPTMLPMHFRMVAAVLNSFGYRVELLDGNSPDIPETGLRYVHNDTCYPAILVIGQFITALESGKYDPHKTALIYFQTGGGCRASNYISLLRKALKKAGYGYVPVISISFLGLEKHPGFHLTLPMLHGLIYGLLYGDLLMNTVNQVRPYEKVKGSAEALAAKWTERLGKELGSGKPIRYRKVKENYSRILNDFASLPTVPRDTVRVGIVGEIFVKYSPLGNNNLENFLISEGAETVVPGLVDFFLYCVYNSLHDYGIYKFGVLSHAVSKAAFSFLCKKKNDLIAATVSHGRFRPPTDFRHVIRLADGYIDTGTKMGEGWLLTAEMLELSEMGVKNVVCTQPFGCLPNHICGKGMMKPIKERNPDMNIVAIDYDAGASAVNQENRLKLMLAYAREKEKEKAQVQAHAQVHAQAQAAEPTVEKSTAEKSTEAFASEAFAAEIPAAASTDGRG